MTPLLLTPPTAPQRAVIGLDPGLDGAAVCLLPGRVVLFAVSWEQLKRKAGPVWRVTVQTPGELHTHERPSMWSALSHIPVPHRGLPVVVEDLRQYRGKSDAHVLMEAAGIARAWVQAVGHIDESNRPMATRWRTDVLGLGPRTAEPQCRTAAIAAWSDRPVTGDRFHRQWGLTRSGALLEPATDHAADACGIALWAQGWRMVVP